MLPGVFPFGKKKQQPRQHLSKRATSDWRAAPFKKRRFLRWYKCFIVLEAIWRMKMFESRPHFLRKMNSFGKETKEWLCLWTKWIVAWTNDPHIMTKQWIFFIQLAIFHAYFCFFFGVKSTLNRGGKMGGGGNVFGFRKNFSQFQG